MAITVVTAFKQHMQRTVTNLRPACSIQPVLYQVGLQNKTLFQKPIGVLHNFLDFSIILGPKSLITVVLCWLYVLNIIPILKKKSFLN